MTFTRVCQFCRNSKHDVMCALEALKIFSFVVLMAAGCGSLMVGAIGIWAVALSNEQWWVVASLPSLFLYWVIYKDVC